MPRENAFGGIIFRKSSRFFMNDDSAKNENALIMKIRFPKAAICNSRKLFFRSFGLGGLFIALFYCGYFIFQGMLPDFSALSPMQPVFLAICVLTGASTTWHLTENPRAKTIAISGFISMLIPFLTIGSDKDSLAFIFYVPIPYTVTGLLGGLVAAACSATPRHFMNRFALGIVSGLALYAGMMFCMFVIKFAFN